MRNAEQTCTSGGKFMKHRSIALAIALILACAAAGNAQEATAKTTCPGTLAISAPYAINEGDPLTFAVEADDTPPVSLQLKYVWTLSPASVRVLGGAGTPSITVETAKLGGKRVAVSLLIEGVSKEFPCHMTASASTAVVAPRPPAPPQKFAEFVSTGFNHDKEQLERLAAFLRNSPEAGAYLIAYGGRGSRRGQADRLGASARNYLLKSSVISGIDPKWIVAVNGGYRDRDTYELWIVPQGAQPPQPTPTDHPPAPTVVQSKKAAARTGLSPSLPASLRGSQ
jgi:hypothetical protein